MIFIPSPCLNSTTGGSYFVHSLRPTSTALAQWDTPTICNGLEITSPERRAFGYGGADGPPKAKPIVGLARVGMIRSTEPPRGKVTDRADAYVAAKFPSRDPGRRWACRRRRRPGEVQSNIHKALGSIGCVTNVLRDLEYAARLPDGRWSRRPEPCLGAHGDRQGGETPSDARWGHDDVIHADYHGAVVVPADAVKKLPAAIDLISRREKVILDFVISSDFSAAKLREILAVSRKFIDHCHPQCRHGGRLGRGHHVARVYA